MSSIVWKKRQPFLKLAIAVSQQASGVGKGHEAIVHSKHARKNIQNYPMWNSHTPKRSEECRRQLLPRHHWYDGHRKTGGRTHCFSRVIDILWTSCCSAAVTTLFSNWLEAFSSPRYASMTSQARDALLLLLALKAAMSLLTSCCFKEGITRGVPLYMSRISCPWTLSEGSGMYSSWISLGLILVSWISKATLLSTARIFRKWSQAAQVPFVGVRAILWQPDTVIGGHRPSSESPHPLACHVVRTIFWTKRGHGRVGIADC